MSGANVIRAETVEAEPISGVRCVKDPLIIESDFPAYLLDESKMTGKARYLFFPRSEGELASVIEFLGEQGETISISGARTGIVGSAVSQGGGIVSTERMDRVIGIGWDEDEGRYYVRCEPAVTLAHLEEILVRPEGGGLEELTEGSLEDFGKGSYHYPVDPTERGASVGGTVATNASGARTFRYGPTRDWVRRLRVMLPDGHVLDITRGRIFEKDGKFRISLSHGEEVWVPVPGYGRSHEEGIKNVAGIFSANGMDLIDLFIGSEGLLGIITMVEMWLEEMRPRFSVVLFLDDLDNALDFVELLRSDARIEPEFLELMDGRCLSLLRDVQESTPAALGMPPIPVEAGSAILFDLPLRENMELELKLISSLARRCGSSLERSWCGYERRELERFSRFRHSAPEIVNAIITSQKRNHPELHKLGTDISVPNRHMREMMTFYVQRMEESGLDYVIFGHIGDNHPHVNILPHDPEELSRGKDMYLEFSKKAVELGGSVSAEHGIGKLKRDLLRVMYGDEGIEEMRNVKRSLDPRGIMNPGNMFELEAIR